MAAAARRDAGNTLAADACHEPRDRVRGSADLRRGIGRTAAVGRIRVKRQHPPGSRGGSWALICSTVAPSCSSSSCSSARSRFFAAGGDAFPTAELLVSVLPAPAGNQVSAS